MRRIEVSQWEKELIARKLSSGECGCLEIREIGLGIATHKFDPPDDVTLEEMYDAVVAFFLMIGEKVGSAYLFTRDSNRI